MKRRLAALADRIVTKGEVAVRPRWMAMRAPGAALREYSEKRGKKEDALKNVDRGKKERWKKTNSTSTGGTGMRKVCLRSILAN